MDCESLIESLWSAGQERIRAVEGHLKKQTAEIEMEVSRSVAALQEQCEKNALTDSAARTDIILDKARQRADTEMISAYQELLDRIYRIARSSLASLRDEGYADVFSALAAELPALPWSSVRVNPADVERAGKHFPGTQIIDDNTISGGMEVMTADGRVKVINTFEKRLERAWEDMHIELFREDYEAL